MNPMPTPVSQSLVSVPISSVVLGLLWIVTVATLIAVLIVLRGRAVPASLPTVEDVPWLGKLVDGLPHAALVVGPDGYPVCWNGTAAEIFGLSHLTAGLPHSLSALVSRVSRLACTEVAIVDRHMRVTALPLNDGEHLFGVLVLAREPGEGGSGAASYRRLLSVLAHELRTPLTAIKGHAEVMGSWDPAQDEAMWRRSRERIAGEVDRMDRLVGDLLALSRVDLTPLQHEPVNLSAVVEEAISDLLPAAEGRGVRLCLQSPSSLPRVEGDRDRLLQVFLNLLDNAAKYTRPGGEAVVCLSAADGSIQVEVRDDGIGIDPEDLPHVFEPLYRGEKARGQPGTGLGLTIVRAILEQHGSTVGVQSAPGRGTVFRFALPAAGGMP